MGPSGSRGRWRELGGRIGSSSSRQDQARLRAQRKSARPTDIWPVPRTSRQSDGQNQRQLSYGSVQPMHRGVPIGAGQLQAHTLERARLSGTAAVRSLDSSLVISQRKPVIAFAREPDGQGRRPITSSCTVKSFCISSVKRNPRVFRYPNSIQLALVATRHMYAIPVYSGMHSELLIFVGTIRK